MPGAFSGGKGGRCVRLTTLPLSCPVVMKSGNLNFLELSGPVQAFNGTVLPLPLCGRNNDGEVRELMIEVVMWMISNVMKSCRI